MSSPFGGSGTAGPQYLWTRLFEGVDDLRRGVATFIETYNDEWAIGHLAIGHLARRSSKRQRRGPRDTRSICPTNRGLNRVSFNLRPCSNNC